MAYRKTPLFHIVALGPPQSGKTVYLSTLHHVIGGDALADGISFTASEFDRSWLRSLYNQIADPYRDWPPKTNAGIAMREVVFQCSVEWTKPPSFLHRNSRYLSFGAFDVSYADYPGDWIVETYLHDPQLTGPFTERLAEAHVLIGIIDGMRLLSCMNGAVYPEDFLDNDLRPIVETMRRYSVPVHFVITKWDLFHGYRIEDIEDFLQRSHGTGFRELYSARSDVYGSARARKVRIIPVSSVGDFALLESDGTVGKVPGRRPRQVNVEVPLVAAVIDICDMAHEMLLEESGAVHSAKLRVKDSSTDSSSADVTIGPAGLKIDLRPVVAFAVSSGSAIGRGLGVSAAYIGRSVRRRYRRIKARGLSGVTSDEAALFYVASAFRERLEEYESGMMPW